MVGNISLSIVIPLYNGKKYIDATICEVKKIKHSKEIIIIDDGSNDGSYEYCRNNWSTDKDIKIFTKQNGGIASSRNFGLHEARGEYVIFVDQDDLIIPETVDLAIENIEKSGSDILFWTTKRFFSDGTQIIHSQVIIDKLFNQNEIRSQLLPDMIYNIENKCISYLGVVWACLFRRNLITSNNITFKKMVDIEDDYLFVLDCLIFAKTVDTVKNCGYLWRHNEESETYRLRYIDHFIPKYEKLGEYIYNQYKKVCDINILKYSYKVYIYQEIIVKAFENNCTILHCTVKDIKELYNFLRRSEVRVAIKHNPIFPYKKRKKRILMLVKNNLSFVAVIYVYVDSIYRIFRKWFLKHKSN